MYYFFIVIVVVIEFVFVYKMFVLVSFFSYELEYKIEVGILVYVIEFNI